MGVGAVLPPPEPQELSRIATDMTENRPITLIIFTYNLFFIREYIIVYIGFGTVI